MKDYERAQVTAGIERERDFLQVTPMGDLLTIYMESKDIQKTFSYLTASKDPFDAWFIEEIKKASGIDFSQPMQGPMPELLMAYK